jgi:DNA end-binding protein Ku
MPPPSLWSGNLRLSLVLIPVRLIPAVSTEEAISFRQIHEPSGTPIRYLKGVHDGDTFTEVPDEEIVKGYEYAKGHHVLIDPKEIDDLKLEAKHTIDMVRFVDEDEIDTRYWEKPYYLVPDGDELTRATPSCKRHWPRQARSPLANSSWVAGRIWSASRR